MRAGFRLALALVALIWALPAHAGEFRGLYVDAFHPGFKTSEQVTRMVAAAKAANVNALIVQVRKRGDVYYNSTIEPKATDFASAYDPLADVITQAHAEGIEVHAWISVYEVATDSTWARPAANSVDRAHPEWLMTDEKGATVLDHGKTFLDPGTAAVQGYVLSIVKELVGRYEVDGIHLDNIRYPSVGAGYNAQSIAAFNAATGKTGAPNPNDPDWRKWRTDQVTGLVKQIRDAIAQTRPAARLSASVMCSDPKLAAMQFMQDWDAWTRDGLVDFLVPMVYLRGDTMQAEAVKSLAASHGRHIYIGIGAWRIPGALATRHIEDSRAAGAAGVVLYSYHYLGPNSTAADTARLSDIRASAFTAQTATAEMPWKQEGGER